MNSTATRRLGRRIARIVGALAILFGGLFAALGAQAPAQAAGTYSTGIYFCTTPNVNVSLERWYGNGQTGQVKTGNSGPTGCATFRYVDPGYSYVVTRTVVTGSCAYGAYMKLYMSQYYATPRSGQVLNVGSLVLRSNTRIC